MITNSLWDDKIRYTIWTIMIVMKKVCTLDGFSRDEDVKMKAIVV
jgi:hypothetical protein